MRKEYRKNAGLAEGARERRRRIRPERMTGPKSCCCVFDAGTGLCLRVLPSRAAAESWRERHFPGAPGKVRLAGCFSHEAANRVFAEQMRLGLTDTNVIDDLIWYGGVSTAWKPAKDRFGKDKKKGNGN